MRDESVAWPAAACVLDAAASPISVRSDARRMSSPLVDDVEQKLLDAWVVGLAEPENGLLAQLRIPVVARDVDQLVCRGGWLPKSQQHQGCERERPAHADNRPAARSVGHGPRHGASPAAAG